MLGLVFAVSWGQADEKAAHDWLGTSSEGLFTRKIVQGLTVRLPSSRKPSWTTAHSGRSPGNFHYLYYMQLNTHWTTERVCGDLGTSRQWPLDHCPQATGPADIFCLDAQCFRKYLISPQHLELGKFLNLKKKKSRPLVSIGSSSHHARCAGY